MDDLPERSDDIRDTVEKYRDSVLRLAFTYLKNRAEAEDIAQEVFVAYIEKPPLRRIGTEKEGMADAGYRKQVQEHTVIGMEEAGYSDFG